MSDQNTELLAELKRSNNWMQSQLIPRLEKMESNQNRLFNKFLVHEALMKPEDFRGLSDKVHRHETAIKIINSELGISQRQIKEQQESLKSYFNRVWDVVHKLIAPGGILYLILESRGIL